MSAVITNPGDDRHSLYLRAGQTPLLKGGGSVRYTRKKRDFGSRGLF